ncbi:hypothetical protein [Allorhizocola rhizosphaerae]|uniref:hypothetical protein n=1 Tax=Allorhizocola rhizosphaerae TaxID=1872709 RepID=UPI001FE4285B|nr:hypothetical protein [Allorhizocola rhizosphaerae]
MATDAVAAFYCPDPILVPSAEFEHRLVAGGVSVEPALSQDLLPIVDDLYGGGSLVRIHADDDSPHGALLEPGSSWNRREGSAS